MESGFMNFAVDFCQLSSISTLLGDILISSERKKYRTQVDIPKEATRWSCCFAPKQTGLSKFQNTSLAIRFLCYDFEGKVTNTIYNANYSIFLYFADFQKFLQKQEKNNFLRNFLTFAFGLKNHNILHFRLDKISFSYHKSIRTVLKAFYFISIFFFSKTVQL